MQKLHPVLRTGAFAQIVCAAAFDRHTAFQPGKFVVVVVVVVVSFFCPAAEQSACKVSCEEQGDRPLRTGLSIRDLTW